MLAVRIELHGTVVSLIHRVSEARAERTTDPQVEGELHHDNAGVTGPRCRIVLRAIVDHENGVFWYGLPQPVEDTRQALALVVGGDDDDRSLMFHSLPRRSVHWRTELESSRKGIS